jgi:hypothetical protein
MKVMRWVGRGRKGAYRIVAKTPEEKIPLEALDEDGKIDLQEIE